MDIHFKIGKYFEKFT